MKGPLLCLCVVVSVAGCGETVEKATTQVMVMVTVDEALAGDSGPATKVRFKLVREDGSEATQPDVALEGRDVMPGGKEPLAFAVVPAEGDATRPINAVVELLEPIGNGEDRVLVRQTISTSFVADEYREVWLNFDESCSNAYCASGFRCELGLCVEDCVTAEKPEVFDAQDRPRSAPVACGAPCTETETHCAGKNLVQCAEQGGYQVLERACGVDCDSDTKSCKWLAPSNVNIAEPLPPSTPPFMVPADGLPYLWLFGNGLVQRTPGPSPGEGLEVVCGGPPEGSCDAEEHGIERLPLVTVEGSENCDGETLQYAVFRVRSLQILRGATAAFASALPVIIVADEDIVIDGMVEASFFGGFAGPGGCAGGTGSGPGLGPGGGAGGVLDTWQSGAGGGSYGTPGGPGGHAQGGSIPGGAPGNPNSYPNGETLVPLLGGSGGGAGATTIGGAGGGAIQLTSITGQLIIGEHGLIDAGGEGGSGTSLKDGGGGGGSGGAILLEAGELVCTDDSDVVHMGAPGGGGGGSWNGGSGESGDPRNVPAQGGLSNTLRGGAGSNAAGEAQPGVGSSSQGGGGGGGGAGRIRINTTAGVGLCDEPDEAPCGRRLNPLTCGEVNR